MAFDLISSLNCLLEKKLNISLLNSFIDTPVLSFSWKFDFIFGERFEFILSKHQRIITSSKVGEIISSCNRYASPSLNPVFFKFKLIVLLNFS